MKFKPPPKRKKVERPTACPCISESTGVYVSHYGKIQADSNLVRQSTVQEQTDPANPMIQQGKAYAMAQVQQDGCTGNFRLFDSTFGNFLVPVIPNWAELGG